jgi:S-(hydroxymethyl)glutathione dehydrogenase/alcohol dehydrogenase
MKTLAAILVQTKNPLVLDEIEIPKLRKGQILVKIHYSGICGTQLNEIDGKKGEDKWLPHCLGHEAVGTVCDTGPGVSRMKVDDSVVLTWLQGEGIDAGGVQYGWRKSFVNAGPVTTFQQYAVVSENRVFATGSSALTDMHVLMGCAAPTGMGAVRNVLRVQKGNSFLVFGLGGVGLCAISMARKLGANPIIAADISNERLKLAKSFGADITVNLTLESIADAIANHCGGTIDCAVEACGSPTVLNDILGFLRPQGGKVVVIGNAAHGSAVTIPSVEFNMGKSILGTWGGDTKPDQDFSSYQKEIEQKSEVFGQLTSEKFLLEDINVAIDKMRTKDVTRPVIEMF